MPELLFTSKTTAQGAEMSISGPVKEGSQDVLARALKEVQSATVIINCAGLTSMSSIGAANWIRFIQEIKQRSKILYRDCPIFFVDYLNMFDAFREGVEILSIEVPYACAVCGYQSTEFLALKGLSPDVPFADIDCSQCGATMQSQVAAEDYLAFLES